MRRLDFPPTSQIFQLHGISQNGGFALCFRYNIVGRGRYQARQLQTLTGAGCPDEFHHLYGHTFHEPPEGSHACRCLARIDRYVKITDGGIALACQGLVLGFRVGMIIDFFPKGRLYMKYEDFNAFGCSNVGYLGFVHAGR